jgi:hypothetical protein
MANERGANEREYVVLVPCLVGGEKKAAGEKVMLKPSAAQYLLTDGKIGPVKVPVVKIGKQEKKGDE